MKCTTLGAAVLLILSATTVLGSPMKKSENVIHADQVMPMMDTPRSVRLLHHPMSPAMKVPVTDENSDSLEGEGDPNNPDNPNNNLGNISAYGEPYHESLQSHSNFIVADGYGPERWGCSFKDTQVHEMHGFTKITIGKDSDLKPYSCGELIWKQEDLTYGRYSIDMISSNIVGQVTAFFLIANGDTEIDVELTGLRSDLLWCNIWHAGEQNPVAIDLPFDASKGWHNYAFEWRKHWVAWFVDGHMVFNRSDIPTTDPDDASYKVAINSWTQVNKEINIDWAGRFVYPKDGRIPEARFKNFRYSP